MTKADTIEKSSAVSWQDLAASEESDSLALAHQIMNVMEQGIIVWSADGLCELHNTRIFEVLELPRDALRFGMERNDFMQRAYERGEFSAEVFADNKRRFDGHAPFNFDRILPSGAVVATYARPTREGGFVVTSTDVTAARQTERDLVSAKHAAEAAEAKAREVLQEERARRAEARTLSDLDEWLQSCKSLDELFQIVSKFMDRLIPDSSGELYLYSNSRDVLDGACYWGEGAQMHDHIEADACWALRRGRSYEFNPDALCFPCDHVDAGEDDPSSYICIPVIAHGDTVGMLHLHFSTKMAYGDVKQMGRFAARAAEHISMAIANVKLRDELHDRAIRDSLTGMYNRRYFMDALRREVVSADRAEKGFGLISFDADHFKSYNDNHGHDAGDMVLRSLAECLDNTLPGVAISARIGGEEFAVLLPGYDLEGSVAQADILRRAVAALEVRTAFGVLPRVTISAGVTEYLCDRTSPSDLFKQADEALYRAKNSGRDQVAAVEWGS